MIYIKNLQEKTNEILNSDIMIIEDSEDTKKITIRALKDFLQQNVDKKIEDVKEDIVEQYTELINEVKTQSDVVSEAYYNLARNYMYLNSAFEEMKEKLAEFTENQSQVMLGIPKLLEIVQGNGTIDLKWSIAMNAEGYKVYKKDFDDGGKDFGTYTLLIETSNPTLNCTLTTEQLPEGNHTLYIASCMNTSSGEKIGAFSNAIQVTMSVNESEDDVEETNLK